MINCIEENCIEDQELELIAPDEIEYATKSNCDVNRR